MCFFYQNALINISENVITLSFLCLTLQGESNSMLESSSCMTPEDKKDKICGMEGEMLWLMAACLPPLLCLYFWKWQVQCTIWR